MTRKRLGIGVGLVAAAGALVIGARHCLRAMGEHGGGGQRRLSEACRPADCLERRDHEPDQEAAAIAA